MLTAKITSKDGFRCAPNGHTVELFNHGDVVTGKAAEWAIKSDKGVMVNKMLKPVLENKARKKKSGAKEKWL